MDRPASRPLRAVALATWFVLLTAGTVLGFATWRQPAVASVHGHGIDATISYLMGATGLIFVAGHVVLIWFLWRGSAARPAAAARVGTRAEWLAAIIPVALMTGLAEAGVIFVGMTPWKQMYGPVPAGALEVEVVGKQFEWIVRYAGKDGRFGQVDPTRIHETRNPLGLVKSDPAALDDVISRGTVVVPVGRPLVFRLRSLDVLHSFWVPAWRVKQDLVPGLVMRAQVTPDTAGTFEIGCAELCGLGHYRMRATARVETPAAFEAWLAAQTGWFE